MAFYKWVQFSGGDEVWSLILREEEERIISKRKPAFTTILAADNNFKDEMTSEDHAKVHYTGGFYVDFDASTIEEVIPQFQKFLRNLVNTQEFDLSQAQLYASGGKGFHCVIPMECFIPKVNARGYAFLPAIYKEIAMELFVDCLDMRVYTARRGRMFRIANVERPDKPGVYKVPITVEEAFSLDVTKYRELCSSERHIAPPAPPELNSALALIFQSAQDKISSAMKKKKKSKLDTNLIEKFGSEVPPSILALMRGENITADIGFQKIATQLALAAHALGKSEEVYLELCQGLCNNHQSDGNRYNTPEKRRNELRRMYQYMKDNVCYDFSIGGVKSLIDKEVSTADLDNGGITLEEEAEGDAEIDRSISQGMRVSTSGIWRKTEDGLMKVCEVGLANPSELIDIITGDRIGYEVDYYLGGEKKGSKTLTMDTFLSRAKLMQFTLSATGSSVSATDGQVGALADILRTRALKSESSVYTTSREGLDIVVLPDGEIDTIWADGEDVVSDKGHKYKLVGSMTTSGREYRTDLRRSPLLEDKREDQETLHKLMNVNQPDVVAKMLGWYLACFLSQPLRYLRGQFPMLQMYGPAGSGKTSLSRLLGSMHYYRTPVKVSSAANLTPFNLKVLATGSASIPFILDEFKPREMQKSTVDTIRMILRENYTGTTIGRGRVSHNTGQSTLETIGPTNVAPITYLGESLESQSALMERAIIVSVTKAMKRGHRDDFLFCQGHKEVITKFGRSCLDSALTVNLPELDRILIENIKLVSEAIGESALDNDRPVYNMATILTGLQFGDKVLANVYGSAFKETFQIFQASILGRAGDIIPSVTSEASKVMNVLAYLSTLKDLEERSRLDVGLDYITDGTNLQLNLRNAYAKYVRYMRSLGEEVLYDNIEAFISAMTSYSPVVDKVSMDSPLKTNATTLVYTYSLELLQSEKVGIFGNQ
jgi:hypothetical protein